MTRSNEKIAILMTAVLLLSVCAWFEPVAGSSSASYSIYVKTSEGWALQGELHPSKYYETASVDLSGVLPDVDGEFKVRIAQQGGIAAHIDYVALFDGTPISPASATYIDDGSDILRKVVSLDNDVTDAGGKTIECAWEGSSSAPVLLLNANQELYTVEAPLLTPILMTPELMMPYTIQNNGFFTGDGVPDTGEADFSDYWTPTSGHPGGYTYLWLRSDGEYLYAIMEITADNTYDETGWGSLYIFANGALKEFRVDTTSHEYGVDRFVYTATVPWQQMAYEFKIPLSEIGAALGDTIKIGFGSYGTMYVQTADKVVWDPERGWVKELTANTGDTLRFKCTITNPNPVNLSDIRFWDILDCSLNYSGDATLLNISGEVLDVSLNGTYIFKPRVLHPETTLLWNTSLPIGVQFRQLCPYRSNFTITGWEDTYYKFIPWQGRGYLSEEDQINLTSQDGAGAWYHVDNVPYTLNLTSMEVGGENIFIESVLNYTAINLSQPIGTEWFKVCGCEDRYNLESWTDNGDFNLSAGDFISLLNLQTGVIGQYAVNDIAIDIVVSKEWRIDELVGEPIILESYGQSITFEYDATVARCGVDNNTFCAKGNYSAPSSYWWIYGNQDKVTITVPCPSAARAPVITPFGITALIGLLSVIAIGTIARMRKKS
jgi:uncharacterized repeat protein (TIGR01451 family)